MTSFLTRLHCISRTPIPRRAECVGLMMTTACTARNVTACTIARVSHSTRRPPTISSVQHANKAERSLGAFLPVIFAMVRVELGGVLLSVPQFVFLSGRQVIVCPRVEDGQAPSHADSDASVAFAVFPIFGGSGLLFGGGAALYADRRALEKDMRERESTQRRGHASGDHEEHLVLVRYRIHYIRIQSVNRLPDLFVQSQLW